eukprot:TRINITY_DN4293_c0_g1_i10.p1 TRINITY_DN4293_c0_g1~~TRINITY_DN4293_c0_g1_i10.p1  ORF type:complete len:1171 (-),score=213.78 TRINITY_DN4293_c0_g1_i10:70-3582(-)
MKVTSLENLPEKRTGVYEYVNGKTRYKYTGSWSNGVPHDMGELEMDEGIYIGTWSAELFSGFGVKKDFLTRRIVLDHVGWTHDGFMKNVQIIPWNDLNQELDCSGFYPSDIEKILCYGEMKTFFYGQTILCEGECNLDLYFLQEGLLRIFKRKGVKEEELAKMEPGRFFGELSVFDQHRITASVVVDSPQARICVISRQNLSSVFQKYPLISFRFYKHIASELSNLLRQRTASLQEQRGLAYWNQLRTAFTITNQLKFQVQQAKAKVETTSTTSNTKFGAEVGCNATPLVLATDESEENLARTSSSTLLTEFRVVPESFPTEDPVMSVVKKMISGFSEGNTENITSCFSRSAQYLDPYLSTDIVGTNEIAKHITSLLEKDKVWRILIVETNRLTQTTKGFDRFNFKCRLAIPNHQSKIWMVMNITIRNTLPLISQCEMFFDRMRLNEKYEQDVDLDREIKFRDTFALPGHETLIYDTSCSFMINGKTIQVRVYISSNHLCFRCHIFGMDSKRAIPMSHLQRIEGGPSNSLKIIFKVEQAIHVEDIVLFFPSLSECEETIKKIQAIINTCQDDEEIFESEIDRFISQVHPHTQLPCFNVTPLQTEKYYLVEGPVINPYFRKVDEDLYGHSISNYPMLTVFNPDGSFEIDQVAHQGDPICDQFVLERFENRVIFAVADGCNWGWKPRNAAYTATRSFIEHVRKNQTALLSVRVAAKLFLQGFQAAHKAILDTSKDPSYWDLGTTTMLAGALLELSNGNFGVVCAGVGDCKAFHLYFSDGKVCSSEITVGSRNEENILDATDPGGRLGPQQQGGNPDLRNFHCWFKEVSEGDIIMLCSDGVHDNLDPVAHGLSPKDLGLEEHEDWSKVNLKLVSQMKDAWTNNKIESIYNSIKKERVSMEDLAAALLKYCVDLTSSSRKFMENFPTKPLPKNYLDYPGKMDHATCICFRVKRQILSLNNQLDTYILRLGHPGNNINTNQFKGSELVTWLKKNEKMSLYTAHHTAQLLLSYQYIRAIQAPYPSFFNSDFTYEIPKMEILMTESDWIKLHKVFSLITPKKGDYIIRQGACDAKLFQLVKGECIVTKRQVMGNEEKDITIATLKNEIFGQMSFLQKNVHRNANVVASTDGVMLYSLSEEQLHLVTAHDPHLAGRFYHYLATICAKRLKAPEQNPIF